MEIKEGLNWAYGKKSYANPKRKSWKNTNCRSVLSPSLPG